jgi:hypothetical protein
MVTFFTILIYVSTYSSRCQPDRLATPSFPDDATANTSGVAQELALQIYAGPLSADALDGSLPYPPEESCRTGAEAAGFEPARGGSLLNPLSRRAP